MARFCPPFTILYDLAGRKEVKIVLKVPYFSCGICWFSGRSSDITQIAYLHRSAGIPSVCGVKAVHCDLTCDLTVGYSNVANNQILYTWRVQLENHPCGFSRQPCWHQRVDNPLFSHDFSIHIPPLSLYQTIWGTILKIHIPRRICIMFGGFPIHGPHGPIVPWPVFSAGRCSAGLAEEDFFLHGLHVSRGHNAS